MDLLLVALATAFVLSTVDYWIFLGFLRVPLALVVSVVATVTLDTHPLGVQAVTAAAGAFAALTALVVVERLVSPVTTVGGRR